MEVKPGFTLTEVGVIPEEWRVFTLGQLCTFENGDRGSNYPSPGSFVMSGIPFVNAGHVAEGKIDQTGMNFITRESYERLGGGKIRAGDILFCLRGSLGKFGVVSDDFGDGAIASSLVIVRTSTAAATREYLSCYFSSALCARMIETWSGGAAQPNLGVQDLARFSIPLPPTEAEQRAIAAALSDVDALLSGLDRLIAKKRDLKQAAMQQLLTGQTRLPGFHGEWEVKTLFDLAERKKELFDDGDWIESEHITTEGIRLIQTGNIGVGSFIEKEVKKFIYEKSFTALRCKQLKTGDLLVCRLADPAGRACVLPDIGEERVVTSVDVTIFRPPQEIADRVFLANVFSTPEWFRAVSDRSGGTTHKRISRGALGQIAISLPPRAEQTAVAAILSDMEAELSALEARRDKTRALKEGMMQELLTGKTRLVATSSNVAAVDFAAKPNSAPPHRSATKPHNWQINEAVVVAVLVKQFGSEQYPLGRKRCTKLAYLLHRHVEHVVQGYLKKAAGPYNPAVKYKGPEGIAQKNGYIRAHKNGNYSGFVAADNIGQAEDYFGKWYGQDVLGWLEQFRNKTNDELELLTTVDLAAVELKRADKPVRLEAVKSVIGTHPEWEAKLERAIFSDTNIARAICRVSELFAAELPRG